MTMDRSQLADKYSAMTAEEFERINREDLAEWAKSYFDMEKARRVPGWRHQMPTPAEKLHNLLLMQKKMKRQQTFSKAAWIAVLLLGYAFVFFAIPSNRTDLRGYLGILLILLTLNMGSSRLAKASNTGYAVVWLRRFHRQQHRSFQKILEQACSFVGIPITIQDSSFRFSMSMANVRIGTIAWFGVATLLILSFITMPRITVDFVVIVASGALVAVMAFSRKLGYTHLRQSNAEERTFRLFTKIHAHKGNRGGVVILKCEDSFWRDVVSLAIQNADAVIVDVTESSENVIWELRTAVGAKSPENILLAYEKDEEPFDLPLAVSAELQAAIGSVPLNRLATFVYPRKHNRIPGKKRLQSFWVSDLRGILTKCISYSSVPTA
jgi:hypothetical protein